MASRWRAAPRSRRAVDLPTPCADGPRRRTDEGYGVVWFRGRTVEAHRAVFIEAYGETAAAGFEIDHLCGNPSCVNLAHLEAVTPAENRRRAMAARTVCRNGLHPYEPSNVITLTVAGRPTRICFACYQANRERARRARAAHRVAV